MLAILPPPAVASWGWCSCPLSCRWRKLGVPLLPAIEVWGTVAMWERLLCSAVHSRGRDRGRRLDRRAQPSGSFWSLHRPLALLANEEDFFIFHRVYFFPRLLRGGGVPGESHDTACRWNRLQRAGLGAAPGGCCRRRHPEDALRGGWRRRAGGVTAHSEPTSGGHRNSVSTRATDRLTCAPWPHDPRRLCGATRDGADGRRGAIAAAGTPRGSGRQQGRRNGANMAARHDGRRAVQRQPDVAGA